MDMKDAQYWKDLEERYFEGQTTEAEEEELQEHIREAAAHGRRSAATGVMAYASMARKEREVKARRWRRVRLIGYAAAACLALALVLRIGAAQEQETTGYVAVNGTMVADADEALALMRSDLAQMAEACPTVDDEMSLMFDL